MDKQRELFIAEMDKIRAAIAKSKSKYLKADYEKQLCRMKRELREYDGFKRCVV